MRYLGLFLRDERKRRNLHQRDIAKLCGKSSNWVGQIELGQNADHLSAKVIALALGLDFAKVVEQAEQQVKLMKQQNT